MKNTYECKVCTYITNEKSNMDRHVNSKKHIKKNGLHLSLQKDKLQIHDNKLMCKFCNHDFSRMYSLSRHYKTCNIKNEKKIYEEHIKATNNIKNNEEKVLSVDQLNDNKIQNFICNYCDTTFQKETILLEHCEVCVKKNNKMGIIYLIQPAELLTTNRFKIGCSKKNSLDRCKNGYKLGSRYMCIMECYNPLLLEGNIKEYFSKKFKLIAGNECFEGDEGDILSAFMNKVIDHRNSMFDKINGLNFSKVIVLENSKKDYNEYSTVIKNKTENIIQCKSVKSLQTELCSVNKYVCIQCDYMTNKKTNYNRHIKSMSHLQKVAIFSQNNKNNQTDIKKPYEKNNNLCPYCHRSFSRPDTLSKHINTCKIKQKEDNENRKRIKELTDQVELEKITRDNYKIIFNNELERTNYYKQLLKNMVAEN